MLRSDPHAHALGDVDVDLFAARRHLRHGADDAAAGDHPVAAPQRIEHGAVLLLPSAAAGGSGGNRTRRRSAPAAGTGSSRSGCRKARPPGHRPAKSACASTSKCGGEAVANWYAMPGKGQETAATVCAAATLRRGTASALANSDLEFAALYFSQEHEMSKTDSLPLLHPHRRRARTPGAAGAADERSRRRRRLRLARRGRMAGAGRRGQPRRARPAARHRPGARHPRSTIPSASPPGCRPTTCCCGARAARARARWSRRRTRRSTRSTPRALALVEIHREDIPTLPRLLDAAARQQAALPAVLRRPVVRRSRTPATNR